jgi:nucleotide-binding universal stress UspA family protein
MAGHAKILCATDFSEAAGAPLREALRLAEAQECSLTLLHVIQETPLDGEDDPEMEAFHAELRRNAEARMEELVPAEVRESVPVKCAIARGNPVREVVRAAVEGGHDLVVVGSHGASAERGPRVGSTSQGVLLFCPAPVLLVKPDGFSPAGHEPAGEER